MIELKINVSEKMPEHFPLGRQGENRVRQIVFDVRPWLAKYGEGVVSLIAQRSGDAVPYPVAITVENGLAAWLVSNADTAMAGYGHAELRLTVGNAVKKSKIYTFDVQEALGPASAHPPQPYQGWVDEVLQAGAEAEQSAKDAAASASAAAASESTVEGYKNAAETAARNAAASQALADQYAAAAALARQAAETAAAAAASAKTSAEAAQASAIAAAQAAAADKLAADASAAAALAAKEAALAAQAAAAASAAAATESEQSAGEDAAAAEAAKEAALAAQSGAQAAQTAAASSAQAAANSAAAAQNSASAAAQSAAQASTAATNAGASATLAESWAVGGTNTRAGEDTDNARHYAAQAGDANTDAQQARTAIQDSIDGVAQEDTAQSTLALLQAISAQLQIIIDQGGSAGDLNGFSLSLGDDNTVIISYTDPDDETITGSATFPADETSQSILAAITSIADSVELIAQGGN